MGALPRRGVLPYVSLPIGEEFHVVGEVGVANLATSNATDALSLSLPSGITDTEIFDTVLLICVRYPNCVTPKEDTWGCKHGIKHADAPSPARYYQAASNSVRRAHMVAWIPSTGAVRLTFLWFVH